MIKGTPQDERDSRWHKRWLIKKAKHGRIRIAHMFGKSPEVIADKQQAINEQLKPTLWIWFRWQLRRLKNYLWNTN